MAGRVVLILRYVAIAAIIISILLIIVRRKIPLRRSESLSTIEWWREVWQRWRDRREDARDRAANLKALRGKKALIVDPDQKSARVLAWRLQGLKCRTATARNGAHGLRLALQQSPDLIFVDAFPRDTTAAEFYNSLPTHGLPVVFVGVPEWQWDQLRSLGSNVVCLSKPFNPEDAASLAGMILRRVQA